MPDRRARALRVSPALDGTLGRLRSATIGPRGLLYLTPSNSVGGGPAVDHELRVAPR